jgi:hypothetical protein
MQLFQGRTLFCCPLVIVVAAIVFVAAVIVLIVVVILESLSAASTAVTATHHGFHSISPQLSAAALLPSITTAIEYCPHCPPRPPSPSSIAAIKWQCLLSPPTAATVERHLCRCHLTSAIKCHQILSPRSNAPAHCCLNSLPPSKAAVDCAVVDCIIVNVPPLPLFIAAIKCQCLL